VRVNVTIKFHVPQSDQILALLRAALSLSLSLSLSLREDQAAFVGTVYSRRWVHSDRSAHRYFRGAGRSSCPWWPAFEAFKFGSKNDKQIDGRLPKRREQVSVATASASWANKPQAVNRRANAKSSNARLKLLLLSKWRERERELLLLASLKLVCSKGLSAYVRDPTDWVLGGSDPAQFPRQSKRFSSLLQVCLL